VERAAKQDRRLALVLAAVPLFVAAQCLPLMRLEGAGENVTVTIVGAARALFRQRHWTLSALVILTTAVLPAVRLVGSGCLLQWRRRGRLPAAASSIVRVLGALQQWNQLEILLLGMLVTFTKLASDFRMSVGAGLPCVLAVLLLDRLATASVDGRRFWSSLDGVAVIAPPGRRSVA
jgi:paraquat-inducible protein A